MSSPRPVVTTTASGRSIALSFEAPSGPRPLSGSRPVAVGFSRPRYAPLSVYIVRVVERLTALGPVPDWLYRPGVAATSTSQERHCGEDVLRRGSAPLSWYARALADFDEPQQYGADLCDFDRPIPSWLRAACLRASPRKQSRR